jgi:hypothetical protein
MPSEENGEKTEEGDEWAPEREESAPEFMEPVLEVDEVAPDEVDMGKARRERDAAASTLYRERRVVEEVVEDEPKPLPIRPTREERRAERERRAIEREMARMEGGGGSSLRSSLAYKTFYDMVCNRVGVIIAGFGVAMILFTVAYDWLQGRELELGVTHWTFLVLSLVVYGIGMGMEGLRVLSPECEGLEAKALRAAAAGETQGAASKEGPGPIPMIPDEALVTLNGEDDEG